MDCPTCGSKHLHCPECNSDEISLKVTKKSFIYSCSKCDAIISIHIKPHNAFQNNQVDILPVVDFVEKYPETLERRRFRVFHEIGFDCVRCGLIGSHIVWWKEYHNGNDHRDLAGYNKDGKLVMITIDHIYPRSKGGPNHVTNYQTMCAPCNRIKSDRIESR